MGIVSSIKDFIGGEPDFDEFDGYDEAEYDDEVSEPRRSFSNQFSVVKCMWPVVECSIGMENLTKAVITW